MFGMLDYRAHKFYRFLTFPIAFPLYLIAFFAPATAAYFLGLYISKYEVLFPVILIFVFIIADVCFSIMTGIVLYIVLFIPNAIFNFLIDPIPCDGRSKEEALLVVKGGDKSIILLKFNKPAIDWTDDDIESISKLTLWTRFFQNDIQYRFYMIKQYYLENMQIVASEYQTNKFLREMQLKPKWNELIVTNPYCRHYIIQFVLLILIRPVA